MNPEPPNPSPVEPADGDRDWTGRVGMYRLALAVVVVGVIAAGTAVAVFRPRAVNHAPRTAVMPAPEHPESIPASPEDAGYRERLTPEQYHVTREKGTERAFTGRYWNHHEAGVYKCVCCGAPLFDSRDKFESGTGWPSYTRPVNDENVKSESDTSLFMTRTEVLCRHCNAHLGHVFDDGPAPTGLRYCINSASLDFEARPADADKTPPR